MSRRDEVMKNLDAKWAAAKARIDKGIETYRKQDAHITLCDSNGNRLDGVIVKIRQKSHEFKHGANLFMLDQLETPEKNRLYKEYFKDVFNMATLPFYWDSTEPERGVLRYDKDSAPLYRRPPIDACMEYCRENGIEPREHALAYEHFFPKWMKGMSREEVKREMERRYSEISERYAEQIPTIEVVNEMQWKQAAATDFYEDPEFVVWCYRLAEKYFPKNQLVINEFSCLWEADVNCRDRYYQLIENTLLKGARIDAIGMQYHMFFPKEEEAKCTRRYYDPENLYRTMDDYARLADTLQITEVTIPAYSEKPEDEQLQAELIEKLYSLWFSHPAVDQIIYWNLVDGYAAFAEQGDMTCGENYYYGGLLRFDFTPKPAYRTVQKLFNEVWHTELEARTVDGDISFRGFYGKYELEIQAGTETVVKELELLKNGQQEFQIVI